MSVSSIDASATAMEIDKHEDKVMSKETKETKTLSVSNYKWQATDDQRKAVEKVLNETHCLNQQVEQFWQLVDAVQGCAQSSEWKATLTRNICCGHYAEKQGCNPMGLVAYLHNAGEAALVERIKKGEFDFDQVFHDPSAPTHTYPPTLAYTLLENGQMVGNTEWNDSDDEDVDGTDD